MALQYKTIHPVKYLRDFLAHNVRPDGRTLHKFRPMALNIKSISSADGSALVKIGNTSVMCGIKAELATPRAEEPDRGYIVPNVELSPLSSSKFRPGPPSEEAQVASQFVFDVLSNSCCLDTRNLCIAPDKLVWVLYCDLICLNYDGSILDACLMALMAAFTTVTLPDVEYDAEKSSTVVKSRRTALQVNSIPIATTHAVFDDNVLLLDPTGEEEDLASGTVTVVLCEGKLCSLFKPGGSPLSEQQLEGCVERAKKRVPAVLELFNATSPSTPQG
ncbi:exosome complex component RRP43-like [Ischnura elegans]|uniref:exosome complex component RRP43-like n=1 Tax=Ischnura elegans TaxID=197161 RepID=UPI001ED886B3|nr:exosome complex component RRP43-like [Ischnura elegans]